MKPVFKLCAVAKDEGPYLAEWVFHHLHFGFDLIHVYINRTSDASEAVLERIHSAYPQVTFESIDWIDLCDPVVSGKLQTIAYAKEVALSRQQGVDWLMFLDVDEFWTPNDFETPVDQFAASICGVDQAAPICFLWHCELGQHSPFTPLQRGAGYEMSSHLKTLFPLKNIEIKHVRIHHPIFGKQVTPLDADGAPMTFEKDQPELASGATIKPKSAYVIHRMYRSEDEYMALMLKGRPSKRDQLKLNRPGYRSHKNVSVRRRFFWPEDSFREYDEKRRHFLDAIDVESLIREDKANILKRAKKAVSLLKAMLETPDRDRALAFLRGTRYDVTERQDATVTELSSDQADRQAAKVIEPASAVATGPGLAMAEEAAPGTAAEPMPSMATESSRELATEPVAAITAEPPLKVDAEPLREKISEPAYAIAAEPTSRENAADSTSDKRNETRSRFSIMKLVLFSAFAVFIWYAVRGTISF